MIGTVPNSRFIWQATLELGEQAMTGHEGCRRESLLAVKPEMVTVIIAFAFTSSATVQDAWQIDAVVSRQAASSLTIHSRRSR